MYVCEYVYDDTHYRKFGKCIKVLRVKLKWPTILLPKANHLLKVTSDTV